MKRQNEIETELSGIAPMLGKHGTTAQPYRVPAGYFEHFPELLLASIHQGAHPLSGSGDLQDLNPANTGADFTEENPLAELASLSPLLAGHDKKTPYQIPDRYFQDFRAKTPQTAIHSIKPTASKAKLVPFRSRLMKYAVAALVTGVVATTTYLALHKTGTDPLTALTNVSDQEMANYLDAHDVHWGPGAAPATASVDFNDNDISDLLSNISDTELEQYRPDLPDQKQIIN